MTTESRARVGIDPTFQPLHDQVAAAMNKYRVPGVSVGLSVEGREYVAPFGTTNVEYPSPVRDDTLFQIGSTTKTVTGTTVLRLVEQGKIHLDAPVRTYLPDLHLRDQATAAAVTTRHLLTHTAGWEGDFFTDTGTGDDALTRYAAKLAEVEQLTPVGEVWSYNNAAVSLAGHVIEAVTGEPYELAARRLVLDPLGMNESFFFPAEVMVKSFAVGHNVAPDRTDVALPWPLPRNANAAGGLASSARDQLRYAQFHMGDGTTGDGARLLSPESMRLMQTPVASAGDMGDIALTWFIRDVGGVKIVAHGGSTNGQQSVFLFAPERNFALTILTNSGTGAELGSDVEKWALRHYLGVAEPEVTHQPRTNAELEDYAGLYTSKLTHMNLEAVDSALVLTVTITDAYPADSPPPAIPPTKLAFWGEDKIVALNGPFADTKGEFLRAPDGSIAWLRLGGRVHRPQR